jgi:hypothetical protein
MCLRFEGRHIPDSDNDGWARSVLDGSLRLNMLCYIIKSYASSFDMQMDDYVHSLKLMRIFK